MSSDKSTWIVLQSTLNFKNRGINERFGVASEGVEIIMNVLFRPCWDEYVGGEAYNVILDNENYNFNKNVSMEFNFNEYDIWIKNGVLSIEKACWDDYCPTSSIDLVIDGCAAKDDLEEIITVLKAFGEKFDELTKKQEEAKRKEELAKRKNEWLKSSIYEVEIKGWEF